jgi:hypothetical protein
VRRIGAAITFTGRPRSQLLEVLLAEYRDIGLDQVEQLAHHGRHAVEMARPMRTFQRLGDPRHTHADTLLGAERINRGDFRRKQQIAFDVGQGRLILHQGARVAIVIFVRTELGRVDEDARDDALGTRARQLDQRLVTGVQVAHGRHEADCLSLRAPASDRSAQCRDVLYGLHGGSTRQLG